MRLLYSLAEKRPSQLGLIVLQSDESLEPDMRRLLPPEAECLVSRVPSGQHVTTETLSAMEGVLTEAASLLPSGARFDAIGYGCTSGTAQIGAAQVAELVRAGAGTPVVTEPVSALIAACRALGVRRLAMVSPYIESVSARLVAVLGDAEIVVTGFGSFDQSEEAQVARIDAKSVLEAARAVVAAYDCEAVFLSCTNLRTLDVIDPAEAALGVPVLSSNLVLAWHMIQLAGLDQPAGAPGRLWDTTVGRGAGTQM